MKFEELKSLYNEYFNLGYLNSTKSRSSIENRFVLISLINYIYFKNKPKKPDLTYYELVYKLSANLGLDDNFLKGLAIVCENFGYGCSDAPTFGLQGKDILREITEILKSFVPF